MLLGEMGNLHSSNSVKRVIESSFNVVGGNLFHPKIPWGFFFSFIFACDVSRQGLIVQIVLIVVFFEFRSLSSVDFCSLAHMFLKAS